ncbi:MAG: S1C family serine protease [Acidimicrobiales bacterium]
MVVLTAAGAVAVGSLLLMSTGEGPGTPQTAVSGTVQGPVTAAAGCCTISTAAIRRSDQAVVSLEPLTSGRSRIGCGVVVASGGLVVTTADAVTGRREVRAITAGGRRLTATVMAVDRRSDVALLTVPAMLPVASFADDSDLGPGFPATTMVATILTGDRSGTARTSGRTDGGADGRWWPVTVRSVGTPVPPPVTAPVPEPVGTASTATETGTRTATATLGTGGMAAIMVTGRPLPDVAGQPLLDADGEVLGILDAAAAKPGAPQAYLPAPLVVGVARQLATSGTVRHGWLGIEGQDAPPGQPTTTSVSSTTAPSTTAPSTGEPVNSVAPVAGAEVVEVEAGGPSWHAVEPGDVIVALDAQPVRSMAELRSRLYVLAPGSRAVVTVVRAGRAVAVAVHLSPAP